MMETQNLGEEEGRDGMNGWMDGERVKIWGRIDIEGEISFGSWVSFTARTRECPVPSFLLHVIPKSTIA